jgi:hypothetical protein
MGQLAQQAKQVLVKLGLLGKQVLEHKETLEPQDKPGLASLVTQELQAKQVLDKLEPQGRQV